VEWPAISVTRRVRSRWVRVDSFGHALISSEEPADRNAEGLPDLMQFRGADSIGAALIFLHLLEGQTQAIG
jgi:hypothetical protein